MKKLAYPSSRHLSYIIIIGAYALYIIIFAVYHHSLGVGIAALAAFPIIGASWYFGLTGGVLTAVLLILANITILLVEGHSYQLLLDIPTNLIGAISLIFVGMMAGRFVSLIRERQEVILRLEQYERDRQAHTSFLETLSEITRRALEADSLDLTLQILLQRIAKLFKADDCFCSLWDERKGVPVPIAAYGSMSDVYPYIQFEVGERTPTVSAMETGQPLLIEDLDTSPYVSPKVAAIYPNHSMLALPLVAQHRKLGAVLLGYNKTRSFDENDQIHARLTAEQVALVLSKSLLLEEEQKQVKQLTALHDIALISTEVDNEDELINRVTDVIGKHLFPDNFGVLLLDEQLGMLRPHPSYHFFSSEEWPTMALSIGDGITTEVARTGKPQRVGNVHRVKEYLAMDSQTTSELCVPIKFKERILGVINAESAKRDAFTEDDERLLTILAGQIATAMEQIRKAEAERKWLDQLAHSHELTYALAHITTHIEKAFSTDEIIQNLGKELERINITCIMAVYDKERDLFRVNATSIKPEILELIEKGLGYPLINYAFPRERLDPEKLLQSIVLFSAVDEIQMSFRNMRKQDILEVLQAMDIKSDTEPLRLPLIFEENLLGILWVWGKGLSGADLPIMSIFAKQIAISLERARLFQEVQSLALTDPLTGLHNRRSLFEVGKLEFARAQRMDRSFCCMMLDLDHFKGINDGYGHPAGDQVLKEFAERCKSSVREMDLVGRFGGEEFIILLPETDRTLSMQVAERLRLCIAAKPFKVDNQEICVTASIGVATRDENTMHLETLIARADQAMYIAKHRGRNRVAMSK